MHYFVCKITVLHFSKVIFEITVSIVQQSCSAPLLCNLQSFSAGMPLISVNLNKTAHCVIRNTLMSPQMPQRVVRPFLWHGHMTLFSQ